MFSDFLLEIVTSAGVSAALTAFLIWFAKTTISEGLKNAIKNEYDQKLETHKSELKARTDTDIMTHKAQLESQMSAEVEKLKSSLSIAAAERHIKFSKLHDERASVIAETYSLLSEFYGAVDNYVKVIEHSEDMHRSERHVIAVKAHETLREYYIKRIIFLPQSTVEKLEKIHTDLVNHLSMFVIEIDSQGNPGNTEKRYEIYERMKGEIKEAYKELGDEFRKLLGDEN